MPYIDNPRKDFQFTIGAPGLNPFLAQKVMVPEHEVEPVMHGDTNYDVKTPGRIKVGMLTVEKIAEATGSDTWVEDWLDQCQNAFTGGGDLPSNLKKNLTVKEFSVDGQTVINTTTLYGCWPTKRSAVEFNRRGNDNTKNTIEFCVDRRDYN